MTTNTYSDKKIFVELWHAKLEAEADYRALVAQNRIEEADFAWDRFIAICKQILDIRVTLG